MTKQKEGTTHISRHISKSRPAAKDPLLEEPSAQRLMHTITVGQGRKRHRAIIEAKERRDISLLPAITHALLTRNDDIALIDAIAAIARANPHHPALERAAGDISSNLDAPEAFLALSALADSNPPKYSKYSHRVLRALEDNIHRSVPDSSKPLAEAMLDVIDGKYLLFSIVTCLGSLRAAPALPLLRELAVTIQDDDVGLAIDEALGKIESFHRQ